MWRGPLHRLHAVWVAGAGSVPCEGGYCSEHGIMVEVIVMHVHVHVDVHVHVVAISLFIADGYLFIAELLPMPCTLYS